LYSTIAVRSQLQATCRPMRISLTDQALELVTILSPQETYRLMQKLFWGNSQLDHTKEHLWVIGLNSVAKVVYIELVSVGSAKRTLAEPAEVFKAPLQEKVERIVLVHNHPSGSLAASDGDLNMTDRLIQVGKILDIAVGDHLIITEHSYYSMADHGLIEKLEQSSQHKLTYIHERETAQRMPSVRKMVWDKYSYTRQAGAEL